MILESVKQYKGFKIILKTIEYQWNVKFFMPFRVLDENSVKICIYKSNLLWFVQWSACFPCRVLCRPRGRVFPRVYWRISSLYSSNLSLPSNQNKIKLWINVNSKFIHTFATFDLILRLYCPGPLKINFKLKSANMWSDYRLHTHTWCLIQVCKYVFPQREWQKRRIRV